MTKKLSGILAAVSTPFGTDGLVDEGRLRGHVDFLIDNGLHGLVPWRTPAKFAAPTVEERKRVNEIVIEQAAGRVRWPADGVDSHGRGRRTVQHAAAAGADAVWWSSRSTRRRLAARSSSTSPLAGEAAGIRSSPTTCPPSPA